MVLYRIQLNREKAEKVLHHRDVRYVNLTPRSGIGFSLLAKDIEDLPDESPAPNEDAPKVCILDSGVNTNHPLLKGAIAESCSFVAGEDEMDEIGHGTAVASIALYGDLEEAEASGTWSPACWIYNGKVLHKGESGEAEFDDRTIESTIEESVKYFVGLGCRIFNLSIGNINAPYDGLHVKGLAYILDCLAREHDILFVVSAGNFSGSENPPVPRGSWREEYPDYLIDEASFIIDPAPALNVLTVGSLSRHTSAGQAQRYPEEINQLISSQPDQPSPFTRHGPSIGGAVKPDLVAHGGNLAVPVRFEGKEWQKSTRGLGVLACNHQPIERTIFTEVAGTSFSAPYVTHLAARILADYPDMSSNLLRAMLVGQARPPIPCTSVFPSEIVKAYAKKNKHRSPLFDVIGYGAVNDDVLYRSGDDAVVVLAEGKIKNNTHVFYELPLPKDFLRSKRAYREITVTLSYSPVVRTTRLPYKASRLSYTLVHAPSLEEVQRSFNRKHQKEVDGMKEARATSRSLPGSIRSKGTCQSTTWGLKSLSPRYKWFVVVTRQDYDWGEPLLDEDESFALVVSLADREHEEPNLYAEVEMLLQAKARVRSRG